MVWFFDGVAASLDRFEGLQASNFELFQEDYWIIELDIYLCEAGGYIGLVMVHPPACLRCLWILARYILSKIYHERILLFMNYNKAFLVSHDLRPKHYTRERVDIELSCFWWRESSHSDF